MSIPQEAFEKLGAFYLGKQRDAQTGDKTDDLLLYNSRDLTTHGVIIGMTGSGKTGLAIGLLEEAAMDNIPVIAIDPKGDLGNLLLTFPDLAPSDFRPWINEDAAHQRGQSPDDYAAAQAELWRNGLAGWGQDGQRIRNLKEKADFAIYTPGSASGRQVSVLRSFNVPSEGVLNDPDTLRERIQTTVTGLLALMGINADPIRSREHILLSTILQHAWQHGQSLELGHLIEAIQRPPVDRIGVMELESFFPSKDRFDLALRLNGILASPGFQSWMEGEPLHIPSFLYTPEGKPRVSIFSIAHLGDDERMFFVSMLLNEILSWTRSQSGTSSLRALIYMDEIFGFFPPTANPPSKAPMLTLLKQARAYGVGLLLATQNPVDLDYKGLGNTGSWFIGRLQTERDKARIMDALQGAMAGSTPLSRSELDQLISGLASRVFLLHNINNNAPLLFDTRWVMSYLAGPMTLPQIRSLQSTAPPPTQSYVQAAPLPTPVQEAPAPTPAAPPSGSSRPLLPPDIREHFIAPLRGSSGMQYKPGLIVFADVSYRNSRANVDKIRPARVMLPFSSGPLEANWELAEAVEIEIDYLENEPAREAVFQSLPSGATQARSYSGWSKDAERWIQANLPLTLFESKAYKTFSEPGETETEFRQRLADITREARDTELEKIRKKYESRIRTLEDRERRAVQTMEQRQGMAQQRTLDTVLNVGNVLGTFFGSGRSGSRATTAARSVGRSLQERQRVAQAQDNVEKLRQDIQDLEDEMRNELDGARWKFEQDQPLEEFVIRPTLTGITVQLASLVWIPTDPDGRELWR